MSTLGHPARSTRWTTSRKVAVGAGGGAVVLLAVVAGLAIGGDDEAVASSTSESSATEVAVTDTTALAAAYDAWVDDTTTGVTLADDDHTLVIDTQGDDDYEGADIETLAGILYQLDVPTRVVTLIESTRALDGMQSDTWDEFTATWSYHPDDGLEIVIVED
ncbi:hypothetical protein AAG589_07880 [Isoptericola sp. F-RaC21]|uniref:hypothetical protein n=1 Tax=Isoptericola sp. F-RaC21 TaxID=3141452 RepID=UPI00315BF5FD